MVHVKIYNKCNENSMVIYPAIFLTPTPKVGLTQGQV